MGFGVQGSLGIDMNYLSLPKPTFCRVPTNAILGFIVRTYKKVGFGSLR